MKSFGWGARKGLRRRLFCLLLTIALVSSSCRAEADEIVNPQPLDLPLLKSEQRMCEELRNHTEASESNQLTCTLQHLLQRGTEQYDEDTRMYIYESPIYVDLPVTLKKLSVVATIRAKGFAASHVELSAKPTLFTKEIDFNPQNQSQDEEASNANANANPNIILKSGPAGGILARVATSGTGAGAGEGKGEDVWLRTAWTSQRNNQVLKFNKDLQRALEFLRSSETHQASSSANKTSSSSSTTSENENANANANANEDEDEDEMDGVQSLHALLQRSSDFHAGQGGALGTWTLHVKSPEPQVVKDWSLEMCFDAKTNFDALCANQEGERRVEAMARGRRRGVPRAFSQSSTSTSTSSGFCLPGFRFFCNLRANRMRDEMKCVEEGYSLNPFRRMTRRYCCATSRIFWWRRWWRKNLTGTCRRFFRS